jgi:sugar O-acyltransferase (sialic acid O-acetyltransferase NeuD family)
VLFAVIGAGGHSKEVADLLEALGHAIAGFVDEGWTGEHPTTGLPVVADVAELTFGAAVLAIGDPIGRARWFDGLRETTELPALVHPTATVSPSATLGDAVQVMQNVVVNAAAKVGDDCILNVACTVAHDCVMGAHTHMGPGARMGGASRVGSRCLIGTNATVMPGVTVGEGCTVGAGAVCVEDVADGVTVAGVPARPLPGVRAGSAQR